MLSAKLRTSAEKNIDWFEWLLYSTSDEVSQSWTSWLYFLALPWFCKFQKM